MPHGPNLWWCGTQSMWRRRMYAQDLCAAQRRLWFGIGSMWQCVVVRRVREAGGVWGGGDRESMWLHAYLLRVREGGMWNAFRWLRWGRPLWKLSQRDGLRREGAKPLWPGAMYSEDVREYRSELWGIRGRVRWGNRLWNLRGAANLWGRKGSVSLWMYANHVCIAQR